MRSVATLILALLSPLLSSCSEVAGVGHEATDPADERNVLVNEHRGYLEFRDRPAFEAIAAQLAAKTEEELDAWERTLPPFRSARSIYSQAVAEDLQLAAAGIGGARHADFVIAHQDLFTFHPDGYFELDLPANEYSIERFVNQDGYVKIGPSLFEYRSRAIKEIVDGDENTLARLDQINESSRDANVIVYQIETRAMLVDSPPSSGGVAGFSGNSQCTGYTSGEGQRVIGQARVSQSITTDVFGNLGFPGEVVCSASMGVSAVNQIHGVFGWQAKPTGQLSMSGVVYLYSFGTSFDSRTINVSATDTVSSISRTLYQTGWVPCSLLPGGSFALSVSGYMEYHGRHDSYCELYGLNQDHFYTIYPGERDNAIVSFGFHNAGIAAHIYGVPMPDTTPLYRLMLPSNRHFYTIDRFERDFLVATGSVPESDAGYIYGFQAPGTTPLYRLVEGPNGGPEHFFTISQNERDFYIERYGFLLEGIAGYVYSTPVPNSTPLYRLFK